MAEHACGADDRAQMAGAACCWRCGTPQVDMVVTDTE
jgi:hypothetical protein